PGGGGAGLGGRVTIRNVCSFITLYVRVLKKIAMLMQYIRADLRHARYEILADDGSFYGEIPECNGVYTNATTLEDCREQLAEVLEEWVFFLIHRHLPLPVIDGIELTIKEVA